MTGRPQPSEPVKDVAGSPRLNVQPGSSSGLTADTSGPFDARSRALADVTSERDRQDAKWGGVPGVDRTDDHTYAAVLTEEVGEACQAWLERDVIGLRMELIQVAAVAVAWVEEIDNGGGIARP